MTHEYGCKFKSTLDATDAAGLRSVALGEAKLHTPIGYRVIEDTIETRLATDHLTGESAYISRWLIEPR
jgi:hypothetical protein